jgi:glutamine amidotransferase
MIVIVDFGIGNLNSVLHKVKKVGIEAIISSRIEDIEQAEKLILPGVGAFGAGVENLKSLGLVSILNHKVVEKKTPVLGICLGMQLFAKRSEEGNVEGLGWVDAEVRRFRFEDNNSLRIPHVGWNIIQPQQETQLFKGIVPGQRFYFTHSFHLRCSNPEDVLATTFYGYEFVSALRHENIYGVQFHPEKSHRRGIEIIRNFVEYVV